MSELYKRIAMLCEEHGISITAMCKACGASRGSLGDLKSGKISKLNSDTLILIAEHFGVSVDYLLGKEDKKISASPAEPNKAELISMIQNMSQEEAARMLAMAKVMFGEK